MGKKLAEKITVKRWRAYNSLLFFGALLLTLFLSFQPGVTSAAVTSPLMHNSANLGTKYGSWGTTYGCSTCHNAATSNIKRVAVTISTPTGLRPVTFNRITSGSVTLMGVMGNDQRANLNSSTNVCEVCHHNTIYHQYSSVKATVTKSHNNRLDCILCHSHSAGFSASATCGSCHPSAGGLVATTATNATGGVVGAHAKHTGAPYNMLCATCHSGYTTSPMGNGIIQLGFQITKANFSRFSSGTQSVYGTYSGSNTLATGYSWAATQTGTTVYTGAGTNASCNVYCHGGWANARTTADISWKGAAMACNSCHFDKSNAPAGAGSHQVHLNLVGASVALTCANCHPSGSYTTGHLNGTVNWALSGTGYNGSSKYNGALSGAKINIAGSSSYNSCATTVCHGQNSPAPWGTAVTANNTCLKCHGQKLAIYTNVSAATVAPGGSGTDTGGNSVATSPRVGAHQTHLTAADGISDKIHCGECHVVVTTVADATHLNYTTATVRFGTLATSQGHAPTATRSSGLISCATTYCHTGKLNSGSNMTPLWVNSGYVPATMTIAGCGNCHGFPPAASTGHPSVTAPTAFPVGTTCSCHPNMLSTGTTYATIFRNKNLHINGFINVSTNGSASHSYPNPGATHMNAVGATTPTSGCSCHNSTAAGTYPVARGTAPNCLACHKSGLLRTVATSSCYDCHGATAISGQPSSNVFPNISGNHTKHIAQALTCANCHSGYGTGSVKHGFSNTSATTKGKVAFSGLTVTAPTWTPATATCSAACHVAAVWGTHLGCINCHSATITRTKGRPGTTLAAVTTEFALAWGHKKTGRAAVSDDDCIVCHLEGSGTTHKTTAYHGDGNIDLRDPDGAGETPITNMSNAAWTFQRFSTSYAAGSRVANGQTLNTIDNIISQKFCLKCHDGNGATNPTARSNNGGTGTAAMPFGGIALGTTYTALNGAIGTQGLINVFSQFSTGNASRHPVRGSRIKDFPYSTRLAAPYNNIGTARDANAAASHTTAVSVVINCFDCHNTVTSPLTLRTVAAHGNAVTLRGTIYATTASTLCTTCHIGYTVTGNHSTGSAWSVTGSSHNASSTCQYCHGSSINTTAQVRPIRAQDYHGNNALVGGGKWPTVLSRPYAFIRGWSTTAYHRPYRASEFTTGSATCGTGACPNGGLVGDGSTRTYTAGGTY